MGLGTPDPGNSDGVDWSQSPLQDQLKLGTSAGADTEQDLEKRVKAKNLC